MTAAGQHGLVSLRQLRTAGLSQSTVDRETAKGRLHHVFRGVYAIGHPNIGDRGRLMAAVLACGAPSVVSHGSAAGLLGLWDRPPHLVHVVAPPSRGRKIPGIRWHRVPPPTAPEQVVVDGIPSTNASRTLVDLAGTVGEMTLRQAIEQAAVLNLLDAADIEGVLAERRRRGAPALRRLLQPWRAHSTTPRLRSRAEARFLAFIAEAGLPPPRTNELLHPGGRRLEVDFVWPRRRLVVEMDGHAFHSDRAAFERDRRRDRLLLGAGYRVLRLTWRQLESEPRAVVATIRTLLGG